MTWGNVYITDKSGKKFFNTLASPMARNSEKKNLQRHLDAAAKHPAQYAWLDLATAHIVDENHIEVTMSDDELLAELTA